MTDKEAIKQLELIAINLTNEIGTAQSEYASKILDAYNTAQEALKEREERQKGCKICTAGDGEFTVLLDKWGEYDFCPKCGRNLRGDKYAG